MPSVSTNTNNAIVISHSNGTAGTVGATGSIGTGGTQGQSFGNWAVGSGNPNPVTNLNGYVDENGDAVTLFNGSYYMDTQTGDVWEFTLFPSPVQTPATNQPSITIYGSWAITGDNYAGPQGVSAYKEDVHIFNKSGGGRRSINSDAKYIMSIMYAGTLTTGAEPTTVEVCAYGSGRVETGDMVAEFTLEDKAGTIYADYTMQISQGQFQVSSTEQRILTFNILTTFPTLNELLYLKLNYYSTDQSGRSTGQIIVPSLHVY